MTEVPLSPTMPRETQKRRLRGATLHARMQGVVFWLAVWATLLSALLLGANRPVSWLLLATVALSLFTAQSVLDFFDADAPGRWRRILPVAILYIGVVGWAIIQAGPAPVAGWEHPAWAEIRVSGASISVDPGASFQGALRLLTYAALFWIAAQGGRAEMRARRFVATVAVWSVMLALYGLIALFTNFNPITGEPYYKGVVTASYINRNAYALYAGFGAIACLAALGMQISSSQRTRKSARQILRAFLDALMRGGWVYLVGFAIMSMAILYTESRAGTAASLAGVGVFLAIVLSRLGLGWRIATWTLVALPILTAGIGAGGLGDRLSLRNPLEDGRVEAYERMVAGIEAAPWYGHGLGAFQDAFRPYMTNYMLDLDWDLAHNAYLENAFELGLPGLAALLLALVLIAWQLRRGAQKRRRMRPVPAFAIAALTAGGLHSLVDFSLQMPATTALLAMILGIGWTQSRREVAATLPLEAIPATAAAASPDAILAASDAQSE